MIHIYMYLERLLSLGSDGDLDLLPLGGEREGEGDIFLPHNQHSQHKSNFNKYKIIVQQKTTKTTYLSTLVYVIYKSIKSYNQKHC